MEENENFSHEENTLAQRNTSTKILLLSGTTNTSTENSSSEFPEINAVDPNNNSKSQFVLFDSKNSLCIYLLS